VVVVEGVGWVCGGGGGGVWGWLCGVVRVVL